MTYTRKKLIMGRVPQPEDSRGSLKWTQRLINDHPGILEAQLRPLLGLAHGEALRWLSPLRSDDYAEYRDRAFIDRLGINLPNRTLESFWPEGGPQWDALGRSVSGKAVLLEAKAHISEVLSSPCQASELSLRKIRRSLSETESFLRAKPGLDWSKRFYQYANRLAHIYLLREVNGIDAHLVFLYFLGDAEMNGPESKGEWKAAIAVLHEALGIRARVPSRYVHDVFLDVSELADGLA